MRTILSPQALANFNQVVGLKQTTNTAEIDEATLIAQAKAAIISGDVNAFKRAIADLSPELIVQGQNDYKMSVLAQLILAPFKAQSKPEEITATDRSKMDEFLLALKAKGVDFNSAIKKLTDDSSNSCLSLALVSTTPFANQIINFILDQGANIDVKFNGYYSGENGSEKPRLQEPYRSYNKKNLPALLLALERRYIDAATTKRLIGPKTDFKYQDEKGNWLQALTCTDKKYDLDLVQRFLTAGVSLYAKPDHYNITPLSSLLSKKRGQETSLEPLMDLLIQAITRDLALKTSIKFNPNTVFSNLIDIDLSTYSAQERTKYQKIVSLVLNLIKDTKGFNLDAAYNQLAVKGNTIVFDLLLEAKLEPAINSSYNVVHKASYEGQVKAAAYMASKMPKLLQESTKGNQDSPGLRPIDIGLSILSHAPEQIEPGRSYKIRQRYYHAEPKAIVDQALQDMLAFEENSPTTRRTTAQEKLTLQQAVNAGASKELIAKLLAKYNHSYVPVWEAVHHSRNDLLEEFFQRDNFLDLTTIQKAEFGRREINSSVLDLALRNKLENDVPASKRTEEVIASPIKVEHIEQLIAKGAKVKGTVLAYLAFNYGPLVRNPILQKLTKANLLDDNAGQMLMLAAIQMNDAKLIDKLHQEFAVSPNFIVPDSLIHYRYWNVDNDPHTFINTKQLSPLQLASFVSRDRETGLVNDFSVIDSLLKAGADPNLITYDKAGTTILHYLAQEPILDTELMKRLVEGGANLEQTNKQGKTPLEIIAELPNKPGFTRFQEWLKTLVA